jgi:4-hydroxythreonine-4-phosphate dehydrogenase
MSEKNRKPIVGITQGDGNGIGYEVIIKSLSDVRMLESFTPVIYGSSKIFGFYKKLLHNIENIDTYVISDIKEAKPKKVNIVNCLPDNVFVEPGKCTPEAAKCAITALKCAIKDIKAGDIDIMVTAPVCKKSLADEGLTGIGHMEFLKEEFKVDDVAMFMVSDQLKLSAVTNHIPLREVPSAISIEKIVRKLHLMNESLKRDFGVIQPKIAVLGLNPHCGENGLLDKEEREIILPAIKQASDEGILAFGPYSGDGFFGYGEYQKFDATLAMYHDQGLGPFKAISFRDGVNFTAGLPIVRTAPDHGASYDIAGRDEADPQSMMSAIYTGIDILRRREAYDKMKASASFKSTQEILE